MSCCCWSSVPWVRRSAKRSRLIGSLRRANGKPPQKNYFDNDPRNMFFFCVHLISFKKSELFLLSKHQKALQTKNTHQLDTTICHRAHVILAQVTAVCATVLATGGVPSAPKVFGPKNFKLWVCRSRRIASGLAANSLTFALQIFETLTTNMKPQKRCEKILQWKMASLWQVYDVQISPVWSHLPYRKELILHDSKGGLAEVSTAGWRAHHGLGWRLRHGELGFLHHFSERTLGEGL